MLLMSPGEQSRVDGQKSVVKDHFDLRLCYSGLVP